MLARARLPPLTPKKTPATSGTQELPSQSASKYWQAKVRPGHMMANVDKMPPRMKGALLCAGSSRLLTRARRTKKYPPSKNRQRPNSPQKSCPALPFPCTCSITAKARSRAIPTSMSTAKKRSFTGLTMIDRRPEDDACILPSLSSPCAESLFAPAGKTHAQNA